jgi:pyrimidine deaminase RibD-like protein
MEGGHHPDREGLHREVSRRWGPRRCAARQEDTGPHHAADACVVVAADCIVGSGIQRGQASERARRLAIARYPSVYLFKFYNMRNEKFKDLRDDLKDSSR